MKKNDQIAVLPIFREAPAFLDFREDLYFPKKNIEIKHNLWNRGKQNRQQILFCSFITMNPVQDQVMVLAETVSSHTQTQS